MSIIGKITLRSILYMDISYNDCTVFKIGVKIFPKARSLLDFYKVKMKVSDFMENNKNIEDLNGIIKGAYYISFPLSFIGFMIPIYAIDMGASSMEMAMIYTMFSVITIVIKPFVGKLIDLRGRKTGILIGGILYACALITLFLGKSYEFILISRILQSAAAAFMWISLDTMISDVSSFDKMGKNFGRVQQILNKGELLGSFIGFNLYFTQTIENINYIFGIYVLFVIWGIYNAFRYGKETLNKNNHIKLEIKINKNLLKEIFKKNFIIYLIFTFVICFLSSMTAPIFFVYIRDNITSSISKISLMFIPSALLSTIFPQKFGELCDKFGKISMMTIGILISAIFTLFIPFSKGILIYTIVYTIISLGDIIVSPVWSAMTSEFCGRDKRGVTYGIRSMIASIASALGPIVGAVIYDNLGSAMVFYIQGIILILCAVCVKLVLGRMKIAHK